MNTTSERLKELFALHVSKKATELEQLELWDYVDDPVFAPEIERLLGSAFLAQTDEHSLGQEQADRMLQQVFKSGDSSKPKIKTRALWPRIGIVAAIATIIVSVGIWFYTANQNDYLNQAALKNISPGKQGATLTLANGKKISLTDAKNGDLAKEAGVTITKTSDGQLLYNISNNETSPKEDENGQYNTLSTAKGETYQVKLPDGSRVYLNAASSVTYKTSLASDQERRVELHGEGYFEIAKISHFFNGLHKSIPFIVTVAQQEVKVLGTKFNINSYTDEEQVKTTLLEGAVQVSANTSAPGTNNDAAILKPNQEATWSSDHRLSIKNVNAQDAIAWKNGFFRFEDASAETVLRQLARWYDVEIVYTGKMPKHLFTGEIYKNLSFAEALKIMGFAKVKFKIQGKKIIVSP